MKVTVQADRVELLEEAAESGCDKVRFGSEFCEWKVPSMNALEEAYDLAEEKGKAFVYVTPRISNRGLEILRRQLAFLDGKDGVGVVINDLGLLNILGYYPNLRPRLGRQLVYMPARCPWPQITRRFDVGFFDKKRVEKFFYQTSMNYEPTIQFFRGHGVEGVDVDWVPRCFPHLNFLVKRGLNLAMYLHLVPVTLTRRCHTARFLGETRPESCSRQCNKKAFLLKQEVMGTELYLQGNAVFHLAQPSQTEVKRLCEEGVDEFVITMSPITRVESRGEIDSAIESLNPH